MYGLLGMCNDVVYIHSMESRDAYGKRTMEEPKKKYQCRIVITERAVMTSEGMQGVSKADIYIPGDQPINKNSKVELEDGSNPTILDVVKFPDLLGQIVYTKLVCGSAGFFRRAKGM